MSLPILGKQGFQVIKDLRQTFRRGKPEVLCQCFPILMFHHMMETRQPGPVNFRMVFAELGRDMICHVADQT